MLKASRFFLSKSAVALVSMALVGGCSAFYDAPPSRQPAPRTPRKPVPAIHDTSIIISVNINFTYTPKDPAQARSVTPRFILNRLNELGRAQNNTFALQNGQQNNFTLNFNINNYNEQFSGNLNFSGWGEGFIHNFTTQYPYNDPEKMMLDLTDQAYGFIRTGWHYN